MKMKALSKRRGRPRKKEAIRTESGQISRAKEPPSKLALEVRARMFNLSMERAMDQQCGDFLGRLHMAYQSWSKAGCEGRQPDMSISTAQYHAIETFRSIHNNNAKAVQSAGAQYEAPTGIGGTGDPEAYEKWVKASKAKYEAARRAIQDAQKEDRTVKYWEVVDLVVLQGLALPRMISGIRSLGIVLARHFRTS